jgi:hypothetical protein
MGCVSSGVVHNIRIQDSKQTHGRVESEAYCKQRGRLVSLQFGLNYPEMIPRYDRIAIAVHSLIESHSL